MALKAVAIIGARLNSSRLPKKHLLPLAGKPLIEQLCNRVNSIPGLEKSIIATTDDDYNLPLVKWAESTGQNIFAFEGDVNDLMGRVDAVVRQENADIVVYICGDSPLIEPNSIGKIITELKLNPDGDVAELTGNLQGNSFIHEGFIVYSRKFWDKLAENSTEVFEKEHVGSVYHHLKKVMPNKIIAVEEEPIFSTIQHRISVDTPSDYEFMKILYEEWFRENSQDTIVDLKWVISKLANEPELKSINDHVHQKEVKEVSKKIGLLTEIGEKTGLGHFGRIKRIARGLQDHISAGVHLYIRGPKISDPELDIIPHTWIKDEKNLLIKLSKMDCFIFDIKQDFCNIQNIVNQLNKKKIPSIAIDGWFEIENISEYFVPSFYGSKELVKKLGEKLTFGWDQYFLQVPSGMDHSNPIIKNIIVITGSATQFELEKKLPQKLEKEVSKTINITWVVGPYSNEPDLPKDLKHNWSILKSPPDLTALLKNYDLAIVAHGVSFFETLREGLPSITFDATGNVNQKEWQALKELEITSLARDINQISEILESTINTPTNAIEMAAKGKKLLKNEGAKKLALKIKELTK